MTTTRPTTLLGDALDAHGGLTRWNGLRNVEASLVSGGLLYDLKGQPSDRAARQIRVTLREVHTALRPFGACDQSMVYTCARTVIEKTDGTVVADVATDDVRRSFAGHTLTTAWNPLQRAFFSGYALWTYLNSPFLLARPDVELYPVPAVEHHGEALPGIGVVFPPSVPTHSRHQRFYFGPDRLLRRHDYRVDIAGAFPASQYLGDYTTAAGLAVPTTRRAYRATDDGQTVWEELMVDMAFSDIAFTA